ncbi:MAG: hypothetical protein IPM25_06735 [Chloracidobacterium sp.]|nr:hypothetical protein [Chloracidobacterium sp.]
MFVVRSVFKCKPGKAKSLIEKFKGATKLMSDAGLIQNERILVDEVASFWTVVIETEVEDLAAHAKNMQEYGSREDVQAAMAGYMDLVDSGYREIFRIA